MTKYGSFLTTLSSFVLPGIVGSAAVIFESYLKLLYLQSTSLDPGLRPLVKEPAEIEESSKTYKIVQIFTQKKSTRMRAD